VFELAEAELARAARYQHPICLAMLDLDHFKSINDRFGHAVGDDALKLFAKTASASMRGTDVFGRLGGEEFVAILPGTAADARLVAERVRLAFRLAGDEISGHRIAATVSVGIAEAAAPVEIASLLARADAALYRATANGRNRVEIDEADSPIDWVAKPKPIRSEPLAALP
jgi:diguanylate cyclase (GGDEF)-like protein